MSAIEWCERCLSEAPGESSPEYAEWLVLSTPEGEYLGIVCAGCIAEPELLALELEDALLAAARAIPARVAEGLPMSMPPESHLQIIKKKTTGRVPPARR
jgi:hypothetical protein